MSEPRCECGHGISYHWFRRLHKELGFGWEAAECKLCSCTKFYDEIALEIEKNLIRTVADPGAGEDKSLLLKNFPVMIAEECPRDTIELRDTATGKLKSSIKVSRPVSDTWEAQIARLSERLCDCPNDPRAWLSRDGVIAILRDFASTIEREVRVEQARRALDGVLAEIQRRERVALDRKMTSKAAEDDAIAAWLLDLRASADILTLLDALTPKDTLG